MKILIITTSYPLKQDGSEAAGSFVRDFASTLGKDHRVAVVYPDNNTQSKHLDEVVTHYPFQVQKLPLSLLSPFKPNDWGPIFRTLSSGQNVVDSAVVDFKPDHIFALWALPSGYWAYQISKKYHLPFSSWSLGSDIWSLGKVPVIRSILRMVLRNATTCFADGIQLSDDVKKISGRECQFLPSTRKLPVVKKKNFRIEPPYRLAFLGRWHTNKGIDLLLEALEELSDADWEKIEGIKIAGGGPLETLVTEAIKKLQKKDYPVTQLGFLDVQEATDLYHWADYLLIPSRIESIPVIFSDAMQSSCPVIATPVGDLPLLMKKFNVGCLAKDVSSIAFKDALSSALNASPDNYSEGIKVASSNFHMNTIVSNYVKQVSF